MADHFEKIQKLPDPVVGCPNFRRIPGYKVYCCGQPTAEGFKNCLEKVCGTIYPKDGKIIWLNMRQEPNVYVNGTPICARPPNKIGEYAELGAVTTAALNADEPEFMRVVEGRMKENANQLKLARKFAAFMEDNKNLIDLCETGKGNLQWERDIPPAALSNLENLAKGDFKANLGKIIHDIYQTAHVMFADMPQGDHKKRAKYRFASKTLMRILPADKKTEVEGLIEKKTITLDLYEILGQCTWGQPQ